MKKALCLLLAALLCAALLPAAAVTDGGTFTLMVYLCGTDLESDGGLATADLKEMIASGVSPDGGLNVYVQTGGTKKWEMKGLTAKEGERWRLTGDGMDRLESLGRIDMGDGDEFAAFLRYGFEHFPADRYGLVLWDHGAGASDGVCYDEITDNSLDMAEIYAALTAASKEANYRKFSLVGFDACLMADYEMAVHLQPFADYMVASEETEPGEGWSYQGWLSMLAEDPGADMAAVSKQIVDGFIRSIADAGYGEFGTLSVLDLNKLDAVRAAVEGMGSSLKGQIDGGNFNAISRTRQSEPSFGETDDDASDMIDLGVFAGIFAQYDADGAAALTRALEDAVIYNGYTDNLSNISGLAVLVPYSTRADAAAYLRTYDTQNLMPSYTGFVRSLVENMEGGSHTFSSADVTQQSVQDATVDWFSQYASDPNSYYDLWNEWHGTESSGNAEGSAASADTFVSSLFGGDGAAFNSDAYQPGSQGASGGGTTSDAFAGLWSGGAQGEGKATVEVTSNGETYDLPNPFADARGEYAYTVNLSDEDMQYLATAEACLMMDVSDPDMEYYVDLGYTQDVIVDWNQGKLYGLFDGTWPTLDGQMVCIYDQVANENYVRSLIPVTLNGEETYLLVVFDENNPGGVVVGSTEGYSDEGMPARGYEALAAGDVVVPQYELIYWDENGDEQYEPFEGDPVTVGADGALAFGYDAVETEADYVYGFCLNDVFGDYQYTDFITMSF